MIPVILHSREKTYLRIKVTTSQPKTEYIETLDDGTLKIRLHAAPEKGRANDELRKFLSEELSVPLEFIQIIAGASDRMKLVRIELI